MDVDHSLDYEDRSGVVLSVVTVCLTMVTVAVAARVYTRLIILKTFGLDDYAAVMSLLFTMACGIVITLCVAYGSGKHIWTVKPSNLRMYFINFYLSIVFYNASIMATKAAFLLQYYRVLAVNRAMKRVYLGFLLLIAAWCFAFVLVAIFQCSPANIRLLVHFANKELPIREFLYSQRPRSTCLMLLTNAFVLSYKNMPYWHVQAGGHIVTDILVFTLPLPALYQLRINGTQKLVLMGIFSLGFFACVISVLRLRYLVVAQDVTWDNAIPASWSIAELSIGLLCACLPTLRPLVGRILPRLILTFNKSTGEQGGEGAAGTGGHNGGNRASGGYRKSRSLTALSFSKPHSSYREDGGSVERLHVEDKETKAPSVTRDDSFLDDSSETTSRRGFHMETFGTKTKVTTGRSEGGPDGSQEVTSPPAGQIRVSRHVYQTQL